VISPVTSSEAETLIVPRISPAAMSDLSWALDAPKKKPTTITEQSTRRRGKEVHMGWDYACNGIPRKYAPVF
jgi:hypothetical protein